MEKSFFCEALLNNLFAFIAMLIVFAGQIFYDKWREKKQRESKIKYILNICNNYIRNARITVKLIDEYITGQKKDLYNSEPIKSVPFNSSKRFLDNEEAFFDFFNSQKIKIDDWQSLLDNLSTSFDFIDGYINECKRLNEVHVNDFTRRSDSFTNLVNSIPDIIRQDLFGHLPDSLIAGWLQKFIEIQSSASIGTIKTTFLDPLSTEMNEYFGEPKIISLTTTIRAAKICANQINTINTQYIGEILSVRETLARNIDLFEHNVLIVWMRDFK